MIFIDAFLGKREKTIIELAKLLFEMKTTEVELITLTKELDIDKRSLVSVITEYNFIELYRCGFDIYCEKTTVIFSFDSHYSLNSLYQTLLRKSHMFILSQKLLMKQFVNLHEFAADNFTSVSTMYRQVNALKEVLKEYHVTLDLSKEDYFIGKEQQIRHFYFELYFLAYGYSMEYLDEGVAEATLIEESFSLLFKKIRFPLEKKIRLLAYLSLIRMAGGYYIEETTLTVDSLHAEISKEELSENWLKILIKMTRIDIRRSNELNFFLMYILTIDLISKDQFKTMNIHLLNRPSRIMEESNEWIEEFSRYFKVTITVELYQFLSINLYYQFLRNESLSYSSIHNINREHINKMLKKENKFIFKKNELFVQRLNQNREAKLSHVYYFLLREALFEINHHVTISVVSSLSQSQQRMIERKIEKKSPVPVTFQGDKKESDLLVSDYYMEKELELNSQMDFVFVSTFPTIKEYDIINQKLLKLYDHQLGKKVGLFEYSEV